MQEMGVICKIFGMINEFLERTSHEAESKRKSRVIWNHSIFKQLYIHCVMNYCLLLYYVLLYCISVLHKTTPAALTQLNVSRKIMLHPVLSLRRREHDGLSQSESVEPNVSCWRPSPPLQMKKNKRAVFGTNACFITPKKWQSDSPFRLDTLCKIVTVRSTQGI